MAEKNITNAVVIPESPRTQAGQVDVVYVPVATNNSKGIASYDEEAFKVIDGKVYINSEYIDSKVGDIQICCTYRGYFSSQSVTQAYLDSVDGVPVVGKYVAANNGLALITDISTDRITVQPCNPLRFYLNNTPVSPSTTFYAPRTAGSPGQVLVSTGKAPEWQDMPASSNCPFFVGADGYIYGIDEEVNNGI